MSKKKVSDATKAKHVFGGLALRDVFPLVESKCEIVTLVDKKGEETVWSNFTMQDDTGLDLWWDFDDEAPAHSFPPETRVKAKEDYIELDSGERVYFNSRKSVKIKIF